MTKAEFPRTLDATVLSEDAATLQSALLSRIIGQERAVKAFVRVFQQAVVGLNRPSRPFGVFLFTGPTGVGKTELVKATAEVLLGSRDAVTRVDCGEYQHSHEISKLIGSPPGYVGFSDSSSVRLSQEKIDKFQTTKHKINFVLFDEIEEAHPALLSIMLQILDAGRLTLGSGGTVDFSRTVVILTSNLGEKEAQKVMAGTQMGLAAPQKDSEQTDDQIYRASKAAATKHFQAKFMNRVDRLIVFRSLSEESLRRILKIEMAALQLRIWETAVNKWTLDGRVGTFVPFRPTIQTTEAARDFLIKEGTSRIYGARELNRTIDRFVAFPLGSLIGSKQIVSGDVVEIDHETDRKDLTFRIVWHRDVALLPPVKYDGTPPENIQPVNVFPEDPTKGKKFSSVPELGKEGWYRYQLRGVEPPPDFKSAPDPEPPKKPARQPWKPW